MEMDMKIKRYTAASMRAALALVRAEQGPDAVILSSRRSEEGIEVIAAMDYDEGLFADANRQRVPAPAGAPEGEPATMATAPAAVSTPARMAPPAFAPTPGRAASPASGPTSARAAPPTARSAAPPVARTAAVSVSDSGLGAMQRQLQDLRQMLETGLAGMTWN